MSKMIKAGGYAAPATNYFGAPRVAFDHNDRSGAGLDTKALLEAFEKRDKKLIDEMAALQLKTAGTVEALADIEQKLAERGGGSFDAPSSQKSLGTTFTSDQSVIEGLQNLARSSKGGVSLAVKASITSATTDAAGSAGAGITPQRAALLALPQQTLSIRDIIPVVPMTSSSVEIPIQKTRNNNAGMVAEGAAKPESDLQLELETFPARVIAHWTKASRQIIDDVPQLRGLIDSDLLHGLKVKEEAQMLLGDGTGQNLHGMVPQATAFSAAITIADMTQIDVIGLALLQVSLAEFAPDAVVLHPTEWLGIRLLKDNEGRYIYGPPNEAVTPRIFGVPVVPSLGMTVGNFLVGAFQQAATIFDRWDARVEVGYVNDDFTRNMITLLGEERLAFAVKRPLALVYGDFNTALAA